MPKTTNNNRPTRLNKLLGRKKRGGPGYMTRAGERISTILGAKVRNKEIENIKSLNNQITKLNKQLEILKKRRTNLNTRRANLNRRRAMLIHRQQINAAGGLNKNDLELLNELQFANETFNKRFNGGGKFVIHDGDR